jgi:hypothetical protein
MEMAIPFFFEQLKDRPFLVGLLFYFIPFCELLLGSIILGLIGTLFFGLRGLGSGMGIAKIFGTLFPVFFLFGLVGLILSLPFARRSATGVIGYAIRMNHSRVYRTRVLWSAPVVAMFFSLFFSGLCALYVSRLPAPFDEYIITFVPFICAMTFLFVIMNAGEIGMFPLQVFLIGQCLQFVFAIFEIQFSSHGIFVYLIAMCILRFLHLLRTLRRGDLAY